MKAILPLVIFHLTWAAAGAYLVQAPFSLDELAAQSSLIVKATVVSDVVGNGKWLRSDRFFPDHEATLRVISVINPVWRNGEEDSGPASPAAIKAGDIVRFEHFDELLPAGQCPFDMQTDHLESGKTYLICMRRLPGATPPDVFTQLFTQPHEFRQGILRCANDKPDNFRGFKEVFRNEVEELARSPGDAGYAAKQIDHLCAHRPFSEYMPATVAESGMEWYWIHDGHLHADSLGFTDDDIGRVMASLRFRAMDIVNGPDPDARISMARAAAYSNLDDYGEALGKMLSDPEERVRAAAAAALLSYPISGPMVSRAMFDHRRDKDVGPFFVVRIDAAATSPDQFADLVEVVKQTGQPVKWAGPISPPAQAMKVLWVLMHRQSDADLKAGKFDACLDAMGRVPAGALPCQDMYAFYLSRSMTDRAQKYRKEIDQERGAAFDSNFAAVDKDPNSINFVWH